MRLILVSILTFLPTLLSGFQGVNNLPKDGIEVEYIGHASFKISTSSHTILLDPFADKVWIGYSFPKGIQADAIFSTHPHYDHDGGIYLKKNPYWEGTIPMYTDPGSYKVGDIKVTGIKGKHSDPYGKEFGQKNTIWIVEVAGLKIAHLGDNGPLFPENVDELQNLDVLMVPIDAEYHILKKAELATVLNQLRPKVILPMHYKIEELENTPGKPQDLGPIDPYLAGKSNVQRLKSNRHVFRRVDFSSTSQIIIFKHSPELDNKE